MKRLLNSPNFNATIFVLGLLSLIILSATVVNGGVEELRNVADGFIGGVRNEVSSLKRLDGNISIGAGAAILILVTVTLIIGRQEKEKTKLVQKIN